MKRFLIVTLVILFMFGVLLPNRDAHGDVVIPENCTVHLMPAGEASPLIDSWLPGVEPCTALVFQEMGTFNLEAGWVFMYTADPENPDPINFVRYVEDQALDGEIQTYPKEGEAAYQLRGISIQVVAGEVWVITFAANPPGSELGFWWNFLEEPTPTPTPTPTPEPEETFKVFMPLIVENQEGFQAFDIGPTNAEQVFSYKWGNTVPGANMCIFLRFENIGADEDALITRGWYFGQLTSLTLEVNGHSVGISGYEQPGELAWQIPEIALATPQTALVCVKTDSSSAELGIGIRFPN